MTEDFPNIRYGLIGHPVQGSGSPALFRAAYNGTWTYDLIDEADFETAWNRFLTGLLSGRFQ